MYGHYFCQFIFLIYYLFALLLGGGQERYDKDDMTLRQAKFLPNDSVIARKKDAPSPTGPTVKSSSDKSNPILEDLITIKDLSADLLEVLHPLHWLATR